MPEPIIGTSADRKDGIAKVTGRATYAAEHRIPGIAYAVCVQSTIAKGQILSIRQPKAQDVPGLLCILTHENAPTLQSPGSYEQGGEPGEQLQPLQDNAIHYSGQHVAVAVAETLESAQEAASRIDIHYASEPPVIQMDAALEQAYSPESFFGSKLQISRGDCEGALGSAPVFIEQSYSTPVMHHNPIEPHATIALWEGDQLTLHETSQWVLGMRSVAAKSFGIPEEKVRVISPFVGGGFGCKGFVWPHTLIAAMASRVARRPVKLVLSREQMFSTAGRRGQTRQTVALATDTHGQLLAVKHITLTETSQVGHFIEPSGKLTSVLYACPNVEIRHRIVKLNLGTPTAMRAPGESTGSFALESAMDELAEKLNIDPVELRIRNHASQDPESGKPFSSKHLLECYGRAAQTFGWSKRDPRPGSMRDGNALVGWGMATACYPASRRPASALVILFQDGTALVSAATHDLGTGTYTVLAQIAADVLGLPLDCVRCNIGDSALPKAPVSGGSATTASVGQAVYLAAADVRDQVARLPEVAITDGKGAVGERLRQAGVKSLTGISDTEPAGTDAQNPHAQIAKGADGKPAEPFALHSFGAQFVEVRVDPSFRSIRVSRVVSVHDVGRIANPKTATSQIKGGVVWGIGMGLLEQTAIDSGSGRVLTRNLADYLVPVHADVPEIHVEFLNKPDPHINALGMRGIGEIGITGVAAAIANAVYHATGKRVRDLPITLDKLI